MVSVDVEHHVYLLTVDVKYHVYLLTVDVKHHVYLLTVDVKHHVYLLTVDVKHHVYLYLPIGRNVKLHVAQFFLKLVSKLFARYFIFVIVLLIFY